MGLINYSHDPNSVYRAALNYAGKGTTVYVFERNYHNGVDLWYEFHDDKAPMTLFPDEFCLEMTIPAFDIMADVTPKIKAIINKVARRIDDSDLWPISGEFNATERAIRRLQKYERDGGEFDCGLSYWLALDNEISNIVNQEA